MYNVGNSQRSLQFKHTEVILDDYVYCLTASLYFCMIFTSEASLQEMCVNGCISCN